MPTPENKPVDFFAPKSTDIKVDEVKKEETKSSDETSTPKVEKEVVYEQVMVEVPVGVTPQQKQQITMLASCSGMDSQQQFKFLDQLFKILE